MGNLHRQVQCSQTERSHFSHDFLSGKLGNHVLAFVTTLIVKENLFNSKTVIFF